MSKRKVHKAVKPKDYYETICGKTGGWQADTHWNWVTCARCLKLRKRKGRAGR